jgi:hypothetical protein
VYDRINGRITIKFPFNVSIGGMNFNIKKKFENTAT